jgi:hypothetical protein
VSDSFEQILDVFDPFMKKPLDMHIVQTIKGSAPVATDFNQAQIAKRPEMMTHSRLTHGEKMREISHTELALGKGPHDLDPRSVSKCLKSPRKENEHLFGFQTLDHS